MPSAKRILIVDDDQNYLDQVSEALSLKGYAVSSLTSKTDFIKHLEIERPDLLMIDKELGHEDGFELIHRVRRHCDFSSLPILIVSGFGTYENRKEATIIGADDFVEKPFRFEELELRILANLRRSRSYLSEDYELRFGELRVDLRNQRVFIKENDVGLTLTEYKIFLELISNRGDLILRSHLESMYTRFKKSKTTSLDVHMNSVRKKLGDFSNNIKTVRGRGYILSL